MTGFNAQAARAKRPCPIWVDAFQRDTQHLEADEIGAYFLILMAMWSREGCDFPDDDNRLARVSRVSPRLWKSRIGPVLRAFLIGGDGVVISKRLRIEAAYVEGQVQGQSDRKRGTYAKPQGAPDANGENLEKTRKPLKNNNQPSTADKTADEPRHYPSQQPNNPTEEREEPNGSLSAEPTPDAAPPIDEIAEAVSAYNAAASVVGWPRVQKLSPARRSALSARLRECGGIDGWRCALEKARASPLCTGQSGTGWVANFDFLTRQSSFTKLMEGNYDPRPSTGSSPRVPFASRDQQPRGLVGAAMRYHAGGGH